MNRPCPLHDGDTAERTVGALGASAKSIQFPLPVAERYNPSPLGRVMSFTKKVNGTKVAQFESIGKFDTGVRMSYVQSMPVEPLARADEVIE
jgi:hypothetical protein